jgi:hypothetical protein
LSGDFWRFVSASKNSVPGGQQSLDLRQHHPTTDDLGPPEVARYAALFNRRDWDGLRAMLADDVRLIQSTYPLRAGAADVGMFFGIYAKIEGVRLAPAWLEGREVIAV